MKQYLELLQDILDNGTFKDDRTGTGTLSVFGRQIRYDLTKGFPLMTTKKVHFKSIAIELLWFLSGDTNTKFLTDNGVTIWREWETPEDVYEEYELKSPDRFDLAVRMLTPDHFKDSKELMLKINKMSESDGHRYLDSYGVPRKGKKLIKKKGDLGPVYGEQWRFWEDKHGIKHDQIKGVIESIKNNPDSRRHIVNAWNVGELGAMHLPPCHLLFQFYVVNGKLSCQWYQRSVDTFLGKSYNIASYALLTHMIAHLTGLEVGELIFSGGDVHLYQNHIEQAKLQLTREPLKLPTLKFARDVKDIDDFKFEDFIIEGYEAHPHIKGDVAV